MASVLDCVAQPVWVVDHDGLIRFANPSAVAVPGCASAAEVHGKPSHQTIHYKRPDGSPFPGEECPMLLPRTTGTTIHRADDWFVRRDGSTFPVEYWSAPIDVPGGCCAVAAFTDHSERRHTEGVLRERDAILSALGQPVYVATSEGVITYANAAGVTALGFADARELTGQNGHWLIHYKRPDGSPFPIEECPIAQCRATGEPVRAEDCWVRKGGSMMPVTYTTVPFEAPSGHSIAVSLVDLTARRAAEQAVRGRAVAAARAAELSAGEARHRAILEAAIDGVISINERGRLTCVNSDRDAQRAAGHDRRRAMAASAFAGGTGAGMRVLAASASPRAAADSIHWGKCADPLLQQAARKLRAPAGPVRLQQPRRAPDQDCRLPDQAHVTEFPGRAPHQPGGPGGSGLDPNVFLIGTFKAEHLGAAASGYDWIGFDPRGVGSSVPAPTRVVMFCRLNVSPVDTPRWRRIPPVGRARHESRSPHSGGGGLRTARGPYPSGGELRLGDVGNARALDEGTEQIEVGA